jgi:hypothetical protein
VYLNPKPQLNPKLETRNPKLNRTPKTQDFIAVRLLLKKKRQDLDAYLEMLDTQVSLLRTGIKNTLSQKCALWWLSIVNYTRALLERISIENTFYKDM